MADVTGLASGKTLTASPLLAASAVTIILLANAKGSGKDKVAPGMRFLALPLANDVGLFEWSLAAHSVMYQGRGDDDDVAVGQLDVARAVATCQKAVEVKLGHHLSCALELHAAH